jgi:Ca2+-binding EF-hand superfamily protein
MYGSTVSGSEIDPNIQQWFSMVDRDRSGRITAMELQAALANGQGGTFSDTACKLMIGMSSFIMFMIDQNVKVKLCSK